MIKHGKLFKHIDKQAVLLLDRPILSLDDKQDNEFVFAKINDKYIGRTVYFVCAVASYEEFKLEYPKISFAGFWHSLFINDKIDLSAQACGNLVVDELVYSFNYDGHDIRVEFALLSTFDNEIESNIHGSIDQLIWLVSPQDKINLARFKRNITISSIIVFWLLVASGSYYYLEQKKANNHKLLQKVSLITNELSALDGGIVKQRQNIYKSDQALQPKIESLLFLRFKQITLTGEVDLSEAINIKSQSSLAALERLVKQNPKYSFKRHAEQLPTIEVADE